MKRIYFATLILISIFIAACGSAGVSNKVSTEIKIAEDKALPFEVKTAYADMRPDLTRVNLVLANYDFTMEPKTANGLDDVSKEEQVRVNIRISGEKNEDFQNPVQPGEYTDKKIGGDVFYYENGSQQNANFSEPEGKLVVTEVTDEFIKGSVDVKKDGIVVRANFTAKKIK